MPDEGEVDLLDYVAIIVRHLRIIVLFGGVTVVSMIVFVLMATPTYTATTTLLPAGGAKSNPLSGLRGFAGSMGIQLGAGGDGSATYPDILKSRTFLERLVQRKFKSERFEKPVPLVKIFGIESESERETFLAAVGALRGMMEISVDRKGIMTLSVDATEPELAANVANALVEELVRYNQEERNSKAKENRIFVERRLEETERTLQHAEEELKSFRERNRRVELSPELQLESGRLQREVSLQNELFMTLKKQYELAKIEEIKESPVINVLDPAIAPLYKSKPRRKRSVVLSGVVGLIGGLGLAFVSEYFGNLVKDSESSERLRGIYGSLRGQFGGIMALFGRGASRA